MAVYSDRHGVFRVNQRRREGELTQFGRALKTLDVEPIHAGSPQAKGRVARAHGTLQDRLVKEMRLRGIGGMEAGNAFLPEFGADFNRRFAVEPRCPADAHRPVMHDAAELGLILSLHSTRKVSRNLTFQCRGREHQIQVKGHMGLRIVKDVGARYRVHGHAPDCGHGIGFHARLPSLPRFWASTPAREAPSRRRRLARRWAPPFEIAAARVPRRKRVLAAAQRAAVLERCIPRLLQRN